MPAFKATIILPAELGKKKKEADKKVKKTKDVTTKKKTKPSAAAELKKLVKKEVAAEMKKELAATAKRI
jgi:hypothetical protein